MSVKKVLRTQVTGGMVTMVVDAEKMSIPNGMVLTRTLSKAQGSLERTHLVLDALMRH